MINLKSIIKQAVNEKLQGDYNWKPINEGNIAQRLREDSAYKEFFKGAMKKFGITSPKDLSGPKKKEFFNYVDKNYKAKSEGKITETYFPAHAEDSAGFKKAKAALANWFNNIKSGNVSTQQLNILSDLIDDYAEEYAEDQASGNEF